MKNIILFSIIVVVMASFLKEDKSGINMASNRIEVFSKVFFVDPLDTIYIRNLAWSYDNWKWLAPTLDITDSLEGKTFVKIKAAIDAAGNLSGALVINVDSVPGRVGLKWFIKYQHSTRAETRTMDNDIRTKIRAYAPMLSRCDAVDANGDADKDNQMKRGKTMYNKSS